MAALQFIYCKLISRILSPLDNGEQPSNADIRGIAVHKVYPLLQLPAIIVSFYLTFSPLSAIWQTVIFCGTIFPVKTGTGN